MNEKTFFIDLLHTHYHVDTVIREQLSGSSLNGYLVYRIQNPEGVHRVARIYRRNRPMPDWFRYFYPWSTDDMSVWLETRAATLFSLELQGYVAPRIIRTRMGNLIAMTDEWCILITTFIEGTVLQPTLEQLRLLGATLGHLHTLSPDGVSSAHPPIGKSSWYTQYAISTALALLSSSETLLPEQWIQIHADFRRTLQTIEMCSDLPVAIIHADVWAANAVQIDANQVVLIDWDTSGLGLPVLDMGQLLLECHLDSNLPPDIPLAWHIQPDEKRIAAVVDGYAQQRLPTPIELEVLLDAIRFGVAFLGTLHLSQVLQTPSPDQAWMQSMQRRWARLQNRWAVSSEIASLAHKRFEQCANGSACL